MLVQVYTCQNTTLLEITCRGSYISPSEISFEFFCSTRAQEMRGIMLCRMHILVSYLIVLSYLQM